MRKYRIVKRKNGRFKIQIYSGFLLWRKWEYLDGYIRGRQLRGFYQPVPDYEYLTLDGARKKIDNLLHPEKDKPEVVGGPYTKNDYRVEIDIKCRKNIGS